MRTLLFALMLVLFSAGCRKQEVVPTEIQWRKDVDPAFADAARQKRRVIVFFGAQWQMATVELEKKTLPSPRVRRLVDDFVPIYIDATDTDDPTVTKHEERFRVIGLPTMIVYDLDQKTELARITQYVDDETIARVLEDAKRGVRSARFSPKP